MFLGAFIDLTFTNKIRDKDIIKIITLKKGDDKQLEKIQKDATIG